MLLHLSPRRMRQDAKAIKGAAVFLAIVYRHASVVNPACLAGRLHEFAASPRPRCSCQNPRRSSDSLPACGPRAHHPKKRSQPRLCHAYDMLEPRARAHLRRPCTRISRLLLSPSSEPGRASLLARRLRQVASRSLRRWRQLQVSPLAAPSQCACSTHRDSLRSFRHALTHTSDSREADRSRAVRSLRPGRPY